MIDEQSHNNSIKGEKQYEKRVFRLTPWFYPGVSRMCHRYWKRVEVSVYLRGIWRRGLYPDLLMFSGYSRYSGSGSRISGRTGQPHKCCEMF